MAAPVEESEPKPLPVRGSKPLRIGIVGFGNLGKHLARKASESESLELAFVWNRDGSKMDSTDWLPATAILSELEDFASRRPELVVEVAHPSVTAEHAKDFLAVCPFAIGSPTALADEALLEEVERLSFRRGVYVPTGALWGAQDIRGMDSLGTLRGLRVTMAKTPESFRLSEPLRSRLESASPLTSATTLYEGSVSDLCPLAPNNVNAMAVAALAARDTLGFRKVVGRLVADPGLSGWHRVEVEVRGEAGFEVRTVRMNPAAEGAVTGKGTYDSFWKSLLSASALVSAYGPHPGIHIV
ncbi:unnamed protein product [Darwinula stevensoni]|uniref:Aspartate dehydrogenase domain-containing protein n=1 Tax=Darwinula stevensoni TaxID=69355 RepID=A0A7R9FNM4_9CRUS|nr:unnamed protein product [Darwinula stevensoni]CAG0896549.1 unnamed protein product [Darwinula stevensoni]